LTHQRDLIDVIQKSRERLKTVLGRLQRFVGLDQAEIKPVDLKCAIEDAIALAAPNEQTRVICELPENENPTIRCHPAKLNQTFLNPVQNGLDALQGKGELRIRMHCKPRSVAIEFADTGRGMAAAKVDKALDFGFTTKIDGRIGLRLGLPTCNRTVTELGGRLDIKSELGKGTTVRVKLPLG
jgi:two-component system NtrC family sensor kinase